MEIYGNSVEFDSLRSYFNSLKEIIRGRYWDVKYKDFVKAFETHTSNLTAQKLPIPHIFENGIDNFMQLLFKLNIVGYIDYTPRGMELRRWYFKERSSTNIQPQIKTNDKTIYQMHRGIAKALKLID